MTRPGSRTGTGTDGTEGPGAAAPLTPQGVHAAHAAGVVFVMEGARSHEDHSAILQVADELMRTGARVTVLHHGLGRLARLHVRSRLRQIRPELIVVTGAASLKDVRRLATVLGCPLVAYHWPDGAPHDIHRRPTRTRRADSEPQVAPATPGAGEAPPLPTRAVVASAEQAQDVLRHYGGERDEQPTRSLGSERVHTLPRLPADPAAPERATVLRAHAALLWEVMQERPHRSLRRGILRASVARLPVGPRPRCLSLAYHQVLPELRGVDLNLIVSASTLRRQIEALLRLGYEPVTVAQQAAAQLDGARARRRTFSVSFDDGYRDTLEVALPILRALGVTPTVYLITDVVAGTLRLPWYELVQHALRPDGPYTRALAALREDPQVLALLGALGGAPEPRLAAPLLEFLKTQPAAQRAHRIDALWQAVGDEVLALPRLPRYLDVGGVRELIDAGVEIGSHTRSHPILTTLAPGDLEAELTASRRAVLDLGVPCPGLAYPNGTSDARVQAAAAAAGYDYAVAVTPQQPSTRYNLSRRMMSELSSLGLDGAFSTPIFTARALGRLG